MDIKNTLEILDLALTVVVKGVQAKQNDGKVGFSDLALLTGIFPLIGPALDDLEKVPDELKALDDAGAKQIVDLVKKHVGEIADEDAISTAVDVFNILKSVYDIYNRHFSD